jgi:hypothetical protein
MAGQVLTVVATRGYFGSRVVEEANYAEDGERIEVDWAGDPMTYIDPGSGEAKEAYLFVAFRQRVILALMVSSLPARKLRLMPCCTASCSGSWAGGSRCRRGSC